MPGKSLQEQLPESRGLAPGVLCLSAWARGSSPLISSWPFNQLTWRWVMSARVFIHTWSRWQAAAGGRETAAGAQDGGSAAGPWGARVPARAEPAYMSCASPSGRSFQVVHSDRCAQSHPHSGSCSTSQPRWIAAAWTSPLLFLLKMHLETAQKTQNHQYRFWAKIPPVKRTDLLYTNKD